MNPISLLSSFEGILLTHLSKVGYDAPVCMRIRFRANRYKVNAALLTLYKLGLIIRDVQGLVVHRGWLQEHADEKVFMEYTFKQRLD